MMTSKHFPDTTAIRISKKAAIETSMSSNCWSRKGWTDVLFKRYGDMLLLIEMSYDVLGSEGGAASFAERWPNINLRTLYNAQVIYLSINQAPSITILIRPVIKSLY
jgi:hypothetical protein